DPHADEAGPADFLPHRFVLFLAATLERRHQVELRSLRQRHDLIDDLVGGLAADRDLAARAVLLAEPGPEDPQIVVHLRDSADGRARVLARGLWLDTDRRR